MTPPATPLQRLAAALILISLVAFLATGLARQSPTVDEPFHLFRGLAWWWGGTARMSYAHPPLANALTAVPAAWLWPELDLSTLSGWRSGDHVRASTGWMERDYEAARAQLVAGRWVMAGLAVVLAAAVGWWTRRRLGTEAGLVAMALVAWNPTLMAHGQLVTTDLPAALTLFLAVAALVEHLAPLETPTRWRWAVGPTLLGLATGLALATKYSTLSFVPVAVAIGLGFVVTGQGRYRLPGAARLATYMADLLVVATLCVLMIDASYGFERTGLTVQQLLLLPEPDCYLTRPFQEHLLEERSLLARLPDGLRIPLPHTWLFGVEMVRMQSAEGHPSWFWGEESDVGNAFYFPVLLLIKTPPVLWLGLLALPSSPGIVRRPTAWMPTAMAAILLALLCTSKVNIGVRYALPMLPLLAIPAALGLISGTRRLADALGPPSALRPRWLLAGLVVTAGLCLATAAGDALSWFVIGPAGHQISIVGEDWGQDDWRLAEEARTRGWKDVYFEPYGHASGLELTRGGVSWQRLRCKDPRPGWHVRHAARHVRQAGCERGPPDLILNHHILVWDRRDLASTPGPDPRSTE